jgi:hypothetical protein
MVDPKPLQASCVDVDVAEPCKRSRPRPNEQERPLGVADNRGTGLQGLGDDTVAKCVVRKVAVEVGERVNRPAHLPQRAIANHAMAGQLGICHETVVVDVRQLDNVSYDHSELQPRIEK